MAMSEAVLTTPGIREVISDSLTQEHSLHCSVVQVHLLCPATQTGQIWGTSKVCDSCLLAYRTQLPFLETKACEQEERVK